MGSKSLLFVVFPLLITREIKTPELHHPVCALRPGAACLHSCGHLRWHKPAGSCLTLHLSPEMWHSFSSREYSQNNQIAVLVLDIDRPVFFCCVLLLLFVFYWSLPFLIPLACTSRSSHDHLLSIQQQSGRCLKVWDHCCFWAENEEERRELWWKRMGPVFAVPQVETSQFCNMKYCSSSHMLNKIWQRCRSSPEEQVVAFFIAEARPWSTGSP